MRKSVVYDNAVEQPAKVCLLNITAEDWEKAVKNVEFFVPIYASLGYIGLLGLCILGDYLDRYHRGERSKELYEAMISAQ